MEVREWRRRGESQKDALRAMVDAIDIFERIWPEANYKGGDLLRVPVERTAQFAGPQDSVLDFLF